MKKMKKILILFLCAMLVTAPAFTETASAAAKTASSEAKKTSSAAKKKKTQIKGWYRCSNGKKRYFKDKTQVELADELGVSQAQISRIEKSALLRMKNKLRNNMD